MYKELKVIDVNLEKAFEKYEFKFKALADKQRLHILNEIVKNKGVAVSELCKIVNMPQSKLSYHLKILLDAELIKRTTKGTWSYYEINDDEMNHILSHELCCLFRNESGNNCC